MKKKSKIRVLLVNDNRTFLNAVTDFLQRQPNLVVVGAILEGEDILAQAQKLRPQLVLVDLELAGLNGLEVIRRLRVMLPAAGIIALTMLQGDVFRESALLAGADDFILKTTLFTDLLPVIRRVMKY